MRAFWIPVATIVWKDVLLELRTKDIIMSVLVFALIALVVFNFALRPTSQTAILIAPGILWVTFTFAGALAVNRAFVLEKDQGGLAGLMLCPVSPDVLYFGKLIGNFLFLLAVEAIVLPVFSIMFNVSLMEPALVGVVALSTLGFAAIGTLFSAIAVNTRARDIMLPVLFLPLVTPVVIAATGATGVILSGSDWGQLSQWLSILAVFSVIFLTMSALLFGYTLEE